MINVVNFKAKCIVCEEEYDTQQNIINGQLWDDFCSSGCEKIYYDNRLLKIRDKKIKKILGENK